MDKTVGIDEVGRGCWAGPLLAAAVLLREPIEGLNDSKVLTKKRRAQLAVEIKEKSDYGIGWVSPKEVDELGLTVATKTAMHRALDQITSTYDQVIIDGNYNYLPDNNKVQVLIKADSLIPSASAASIIAKVARDDYMAKQSLAFPAYGFEQHVGYGTALHIQALKEFGICDLHRLSYKPIRALLA